jgi:hypothetical protein
MGPVLRAGPIQLQEVVASRTTAILISDPKPEPERAAALPEGAGKGRRLRLAGVVRGYLLGIACDCCEWHAGGTPTERMALVQRGAAGSASAVWVRPVLGCQCFVGTPSKTARQLRRSHPLKTSSLSGTFAGYVQAARVLGDQVMGDMSVPVIVRSVPGLSVRCGTRVARPVVAPNRPGNDVTFGPVVAPRLAVGCG